MARQVVTIISPAALRHNVAQVRKYAPGAKIIAMVKANAYGHGLVNTAKILASAQVEALGVACIEEAQLLRQQGIVTDIVLMEGCFRAEELTLVQTQSFTVVVHHWAQIQALEAYSGSGESRPFKVWLKINTGMNRLGFSGSQSLDAYLRLLNNPKIHFMGCMTHFSQADDPSDLTTQRQCETFYALVKDFQGARCLANSAGILAWPAAHADWVRPGLMLYGVSPFAQKVGRDFDLKPAMTLQSEIIAIRELEVGESVGYGATWRSARPSRIGMVSIGYGDGYPWHAKNGTPVLVNNQRAALVGRVSMDMLAIDLTDLGPVSVADPVVLWGEGLPVEEIACSANTVPWELLCRFAIRTSLTIFPSKKSRQTRKK